MLRRSCWTISPIRWQKNAKLRSCIRCSGKLYPVFGLTIEKVGQDIPNKNPDCANKKLFYTAGQGKQKSTAMLRSTKVKSLLRWPRLTESVMQRSDVRPSVCHVGKLIVTHQGAACDAARNTFWPKNKEDRHRPTCWCKDRIISKALFKEWLTVLLSVTSEVQWFQSVTVRPYRIDSTIMAYGSLKRGVTTGWNEHVHFTLARGHFWECRCSFDEVTMLKEIGLLHITGTQPLFTMYADSSCRDTVYTAVCLFVFRTIPERAMQLLDHQTWHENVPR